MLDPTTLAAIRRVAHELKLEADSEEVAQLGQLVAVLCDALLEAQVETTALLAKLVRLVQHQTEQMTRLSLEADALTRRTDQADADHDAAPG